MSMKKEILAAALLLALIAGAFFNIAHLEKRTEAVAARVSLSQAAAARGDFGAAQNALDSARELWERSQSYTGIFVSSEELARVDDAILSLQSALLQADAAAAQGAYEALFFQLKELVEKEKPSLETVL